MSESRHQQIITAYLKGDSVRSILTQFGHNGKPLSRQRLHQHLQKAGVPSRIAKARSKVARCAEKSNSLAETAKCAGCSADTARKVLQQNGTYAEHLARFLNHKEEAGKSERLAAAQAAVKQLAVEKGRTPSLQEASDAGIKIRGLLRRTGGYTAFVKSCGLEPNWQAAA